MSDEFVQPQFDAGSLELRYENNCVCVYGTAEGLKQFADVCLRLANRPSEQHIHLEDCYGLLTKQSEMGAVAVFG